MEVGHNHLMRYGGQGSNNVSDSFIPGQTEDERHTLTRKQLCERLPQADGRLDRMRPVQQDPGSTAQTSRRPSSARALSPVVYASCVIGQPCC